MNSPPDDELLDGLRAATERYPNITRLIIDEYQLTLGNEEASFVCETAWILTGPSGPPETLEADMRYRSADAYRLCRIVGRSILSIAFTTDGSLALGLEGSDTLTLRKSNEGFESFNLHWKKGSFLIF